MKLLIDIGEAEPSKGDLLAFDGEKWSKESHDVAFKDELAKLREMEASIASLQAALAEAKASLAKVASIVKEEVL